MSGSVRLNLNHHLKTMNNKPYVVPKYTRRDILIGVVVGLLVLCGAGYGIKSIWGEMRGAMLSGVIVAKHFTPNPEKRISVGAKGGLNVRLSEGEYVFEVCVRGGSPSEDPEECQCEIRGRHYLVTVNQTAFERHNVGDTFKFSRPIE